jgi:hypothetical protein
MNNQPAYLSVVLLPAETDSRALIELSRLVATAQPSRIVLGSLALPHITVAQFEAPTDQAARLWAEVGQWRGQLDLLSGGLNFTPDRARPQLWAELQFLKSAGLAELQAKVLATDFAQRYRLHNHAGDAYRPHCSLALYDGLTIPALDLSGISLFQRPFTGLSVAVGLNGDNFTFKGPPFS